MLHGGKLSRPLQHVKREMGSGIPPFVLQPDSEADKNRELRPFAAVPLQIEDSDARLATDRRHGPDPHPGSG